MANRKLSRRQLRRKSARRWQAVRDWTPIVLLSAVLIPPSLFVLYALCYVAAHNMAGM